MSKLCLRLVMLLFACICCSPDRLFGQVTQDVDVLLWCSKTAAASSSGSHWLDLAPLPALLVAACVLWLIGSELARRHFHWLLPE